MNIFDKLRVYAKKNKPEDHEEEYLEIDDTGKNSKGVYINDYTHQTYNDMCYLAADLYEDTFEEDSDAELNIK